MHFLVDHRALDITGICKEKNWDKEDTTRTYRDKTIENFLAKNGFPSKRGSLLLNYLHLFIGIDIYRS